MSYQGREWRAEHQRQIQSVTMDNDIKHIIKCVICNGTIGAAMTHNPSPVRNYGDCCSECNRRVVTVMRQRIMLASIDMLYVHPN